ncbi:MAG: hypothetical protein CMM77_08295 [Rhodospirillaceae bacterium]|nr:hypothetical protein [Rhodospirillaceae bacterium]
MGTQVHYIPVYRHPVHRDLCADAAREFPEAEAYYAECLTLPLHQGMRDEDAQRVATAVRELLGA